MADGNVIWAPWRLEYVQGARTSECIFCAFPGDPANYRQNLVLLVREHAFVGLNRYPFSSTHLLVAPRRHVDALESLTDEEYAAVTKLLREAIVCVKSAVHPDGVNVGFNLGKAAGAGIADHLHSHVVARWNGDTNFMPVIADVSVMPAYLDDVWRHLHPHFARLEGEHAPAP